MQNHRVRAASQEVELIPAGVDEKGREVQGSLFVSRHDLLRGLLLPDQRPAPGRVKAYSG